MSGNVKILLCNIAIRSEPDPFPPVACTSLFNVLRDAGYSPIFYDIDVERPTVEKLEEFFEEKQFDIVGISAVVSTGYQYVKNLASVIKKVSPKTSIILGGNLAAAYSVILRKCLIDICVIGEGERVLLNLVRYFEKYRNFSSKNFELHGIKGLSFLDSCGDVVFTGHEELITAEEVPQPDYEVLAKFSKINFYIRDPQARPDFMCDVRTHDPSRKDKKIATIFTSKGCVNRCTFCHRWIPRYRVMRAEKVINYMRDLMNKYNVGFFCISDECFGEDKRWLEDFIRLVKPLDILFQVGGVRVSLVRKDPMIIKRLKDAGLTALYFGIESGSQKILDVMEKNASREENLNAVKACTESGVYTTIQLVIGMPGENDQTIAETIDFIERAIDCGASFQLSVNYLQSLPGTPTYEFLRCHGLLGNSSDEEERYLLRVSDKDAALFEQYLNVSEEPLSKVKLWNTKIFVAKMIRTLRKNNWQWPEQINNKEGKKSARTDIRRILFAQPLLFRIIDLFGWPIWQLILLKHRIKLYGGVKAICILLGVINEEDRSRFLIKKGQSLRRIVGCLKELQGDSEKQPCGNNEVSCGDY